MIIDIKALINDSKTTLLHPQSFYTNMSKSTGYDNAVIKAIVFGLTAGIISLIWNIFGIVNTPSMITSIISSLIVLPLFSVIFLFLGGLITMLFSVICNGSRLYLDNLRITASLMFLLPINSFFGFSVGINVYFGIIITLLLYIFSFWLLYNALVYGLGGNQKRGKILVSILALVLVVFFTVSIIVFRAAETFMEKSGISMKELQDLKNNPDAEKKMQELIEKYVQENKE